MAATIGDDQHGVTEIAPQEFGRDDAKERQKENQYGQFEHQAKTEKTIRIRSKYSLMLIRGATDPPNCWKPTRNFKMYGRVTK